MDLNHLELAFKKEEVDKKIEEIGEKLNQEYQDKNPLIIGCLVGGFMLTSDLVKHLKIKCRIDFVKISSYVNNKQTEGFALQSNLKYDVKD